MSSSWPVMSGSAATGVSWSGLSCGAPSSRVGAATGTTDAQGPCRLDVWNQYMLSAPRLCARAPTLLTPLVSAVEVGDVARVPSLAPVRGVRSQSGGSRVSLRVGPGRGHRRRAAPEPVAVVDAVDEGVPAEQERVRIISGVLGSVYS